jgi:nitrate/nitrite transport system substrate-binding protein
MLRVHAVTRSSRKPPTPCGVVPRCASASFFASVSSDRSAMAKLLAPAQFLNQPEAVLNQVLTGKFPTV